jgi:hypothetical protein
MYKRGVLKGCETLRIPHFLDNRVTDDGEVSQTRPPSLTSTKILVTHFF